MNMKLVKTWILSIDPDPGNPNLSKYQTFRALIRETYLPIALADSIIFNADDKQPFL